MIAVAAAAGDAQARPQPSVVARWTRDVAAAAVTAPIAASLGGVEVAAPRPGWLFSGERAPLWAPVASLLLPGSGQLVMRQPRGVAYVAAEVYEMIQLVVARRDRSRSRNEFKRIARDVARRAFGGVADGSWPYYEALTEVVESGKYSQSATILVPETDTSTFNGKQWEAARNLYFLDPNAPPPPNDPRYQQAIRRYDSTAVRDAFRWSWRDQQLFWDVYRSEVAAKNRATRRMNTARGLILATHLVSSIDAVGSVRLRRTIGPRGEARIEAAVPWEPFGLGPRWPR